jgi:hypothetical protein
LITVVVYLKVIPPHCALITIQFGGLRLLTFTVPYGLNGRGGGAANAGPIARNMAVKASPAAFKKYNDMSSLPPFMDTLVGIKENA